MSNTATNYGQNAYKDRNQYTGARTAGTFSHGQGTNGARFIVERSSRG